MKKPLLFLFLSAAFVICNAQRPDDSLKLLLKKSEAKNDTVRIKYYTAYLGYFYHSEKAYDSALRYYYRVLREKHFQTDKALLATSLNGIGACYSSLGYPDSSLNNYDKALKLFVALKDTVKAIDVEANMAIVYKDIGLYEKALETAFDLLSKLIIRRPDRALASCYNTIALVYEATNDYQSALDYHHKALSVRRSIAYERGVAYSYHNIGEVYRRLEQYDSALSNLFRALTIKLALKDEPGSSSTLDNIGRVYLDLGKPIAAEQYLSKSVTIARKSKDRPTLAQSLNDLAKLKIMRREFKEAEALLNEAESLTRESKLADNLRQNFELKIEAYKGEGLHAKALKASEDLLMFKDSLLNVEKARSMKALEISYETERKEQEIFLLQERDRRSHLELLSKQALIKVLYVVLFLVLVIASLIYYSLRIVRKSKLKIETLHRELHHRVKNNLQTLSSILTLQAEHLTDKEAISATRSTEGRITAMALIHRKLYIDDDNRTIEIRGYVHELIQSLTQAYGFEEADLTVDSNVPHKQLDVDKVIPLGLILNELISNALKYAFVDHNNPRLQIAMTIANSKLTVTVGDNGKGFETKDGSSNKPSFGIKMVGLLVKELRGNFSVQSTNGTQYTLNIPLA